MPMINKKTIKPILRFLSTQNMGGKLLLAATVIALIWANTSYQDLYHRFWSIPLAFSFGSMTISHSLVHWINDGLMAIFFLVIGLEIKREIMVGELAGWHKAGLPLIAALGGMLVPALIYIAINAGGAGAKGWGIPMATDIAFALGCLMILGDRIPTALKVFLLAMAIVDDIGAIIVIAIFYTSEISIPALLLAVSVMAVLLILNAFNVRRMMPYIILGMILWLAIAQSGLHATLAGVLLAMTIPGRAVYHPDEFVAETANILKNFPEQNQEFNLMCVDEDQRSALKNVESAVDKMDTLLQRLEDYLHPVSALFIIPLFALANAGISLDQETALQAIESPVTLGIVIALLLGKQIGICMFAYLAVRLGIANLPQGVGWKGIYGLSCLAGIGFTMSLFITNLSFESVYLIQEAKFGILLASLLASILGLLVMFSLSKEGNEE